jgi:HemY protein
LWAQYQRNIDALVALEVLLVKQPRHQSAMSLKLDLLRREQRWDDLKHCLPQARNLLDAQLLQELASDTYRALLSQARASGRVDNLRAVWQDVPASLKHDIALIGHYAMLCHQLQIDADALKLVVAELRHHWHADLVLIFGDLDGGDVVRQLAKVEEWIKQYGEKAELLLVAGRLCLRNRLWGRARSYFEACLSSYPSAEIRLELGKLLIQQGEDEAAALQLFRDGLESTITPRLGAAQHGELLPKPEESS